MDAKQLHTQEGQPIPDHYYCGKCGFQFGRQDHAELCCTIKYCAVCGEPIEGSEKQKYPSQPICRACADKKRMDEMVEVPLSEATEVMCLGYDDYHYDGMDDIMGSHYDDDPRPEWAHPTTIMPFPAVSAEDIYTHIYEERNVDDEDDVVPRLRGREAFEAAIDAFNEANKDLITYMSDTSKKIRIPWDDQA